MPCAQRRMSLDVAFQRAAVQADGILQHFAIRCRIIQHIALYVS